jgi:hypothetical protein
MLARLVEDGVLLVRIGRGDVAVYDVPGRRRRAAPAGAPPGDPAAAVPGAGTLDGDELAPSPLKAVLLSVVVPGAGHIYAGRSGAGAAWMACTLAGYACFFLPGLFLHGLCLVSAAHTARG